MRPAVLLPSSSAEPPARSGIDPTPAPPGTPAPHRSVTHQASATNTGLDAASATAELNDAPHIIATTRASHDPATKADPRTQTRLEGKNTAGVLRCLKRHLSARRFHYFLAVSAS